LEDGEKLAETTLTTNELATESSNKEHAEWLRDAYAWAVWRRMEIVRVAKCIEAGESPTLPGYSGRNSNR